MNNTDPQPIEESKVRSRSRSQSPTPSRRDVSRSPTRSESKCSDAAKVENVNANAHTADVVEKAQCHNCEKECDSDSVVECAQCGEPVCPACLLDSTCVICCEYNLQVVREEMDAALERAADFDNEKCDKDECPCCYCKFPVPKNEATCMKCRQPVCDICNIGLDCVCAGCWQEKLPRDEKFVQEALSRQR